MLLFTFHFTQLILMNRYRFLSKLISNKILLQPFSKSQFYLKKTISSFKEYRMDPAEQAKKAAACQAIDDNIKVVKQEQHPIF